MTRHRGKSEVNLGKAIRTMIKANIMAYIVTAIFVLLGSVIFTYTNASAQIENWIVVMGVIISAFMAGFDTAKVDTHDGYKWGAIGGSFYFITFLIVAVLINKMDQIEPATVFVMAILVLVSSTIAGMISVNSPRT